MRTICRARSDAVRQKEGCLSGVSGSDSGGKEVKRAWAFSEKFTGKVSLEVAWQGVVSVQYDVPQNLEQAGWAVDISLHQVAKPRHGFRRRVFLLQRKQRVQIAQMVASGNGVDIHSEVPLSCGHQSSV
jgi:hypothetical protein